MSDDTLIAQTLAEAETHRDTFRTLARDNEAIRADLQARLDELAKREEVVAAREAQVSNTAQAHESKAAELAQLEQDIKDQQFSLNEDRDTFESDRQTKLDDIATRTAVVAAGERDLESARLTFGNLNAKTTTEQEAKAAELADTAARLQAKEDRLISDSLKLDDDRKTYKDQVREEVVAELMDKVAK